jgi:hypothetical protein
VTELSERDNGRDVPWIKERLAMCAYLVSLAPWRLEQTGTNRVGSVAPRAALGGFSPGTSVSLANYPFHQLLHISHHLSYRAGTIGQQMAAVQVHFVPPQPIEVL